MHLLHLTTVAAVLTLSCGEAARAGVEPRSGLKELGFAGTMVRVPPDWPVHDLAADPHTCIRYDRHAVYNSDPGPDQNCPAAAVGPTGTVQTATGGTVTRTQGQGSGDGTGTGSASSSPTASSTSSIPSPAPTAPTSSPAPTVPTAATPSPTPTAPIPSVSPTPTSSPALPSSIPPTASEPPPAVPPPPTPSPAPTVKAPAMYSGLGFDTCAAPPADVMQAWASASPYHAVGVYIGGLDRACPEGNLTPPWLRTVSKQGWKLFPIYVGLQAPCWRDPRGGHPARIAPALSWPQGASAADDAANRAAYFGITPGSPIYFDMEYYPRNDPGCTQNVQAFLSAWTDQLHKRGFTSGIYSSSSSAIADMAQIYDTSVAYRADVAWYAHWNKIPQLFGDKTLDDRFWPGARRIKQYRGEHNETYGRKRLSIDVDVLNAPVATLG